MPASVDGEFVAAGEVDSTDESMDLDRFIDVMVDPSASSKSTFAVTAAVGSTSTCSRSASDCIDSGR